MATTESLRNWARRQRQRGEASLSRLAGHHPLALALATLPVGHARNAEGAEPPALVPVLAAAYRRAVRDQNAPIYWLLCEPGAFDPFPAGDLYAFLEHVRVGGPGGPARYMLALTPGAAAVLREPAGAHPTWEALVAAAKRASRVTARLFVFAPLADDALAREPPPPQSALDCDLMADVLADFAKGRALLVAALATDVAGTRPDTGDDCARSAYLHFVRAADTAADIRRPMHIDEGTCAALEARIDGCRLRARHYAVVAAALAGEVMSAAHAADLARAVVDEVRDPDERARMAADADTYGGPARPRPVAPVVEGDISASEARPHHAFYAAMAARSVAEALW